MSTGSSWHRALPLASLGDSAQDSTRLLPRCGCSSRLRYFSYTCIAWLGYAVALFINGAARRLLASAEAGTSKPVTLPLSPVDASALPPVVKLLYGQLEVLFLLSTYRALAIGVLLLLLRWCTRGAVESEPIAQPRASYARTVLVPIAIGACNALGYLWFNMLCALSGVAVWSALSGCYVLLPVGYGLLVRHESRSPRKLAGVAACLLAVLLLGLSEASAASGGGGEPGIAAALAGGEGESWVTSGDSPAGGALRAALLIAAAVTWGACDTMAAFVAKPPGAPSLREIAAGTGTGFACVAWAAAAAAGLVRAHLAEVQPLLLPAGLAAAVCGGAGAASGSDAAAEHAVAAELAAACASADAGLGGGLKASMRGWWTGQAVLVVGQVSWVGAGQRAHTVSPLRAHHQTHAHAPLTFANRL